MVPRARCSGEAWRWTTVPGVAPVNKPATGAVDRRGPDRCDSGFTSARWDAWGSSEHTARFPIARCKASSGTPPDVRGSGDGSVRRDRPRDGSSVTRPLRVGPVVTENTPSSRRNCTDDVVNPPPRVAKWI